MSRERLSRHCSCVLLNSPSVGLVAGRARLAPVVKLLISGRLSRVCLSAAEFESISIYYYTLSFIKTHRYHQPLDRLCGRTAAVPSYLLTAQVFIEM